MQPSVRPRASGKLKIFPPERNADLSLSSTLRGERRGVARAAPDRDSLVISTRGK